jgi:SAM-dependent methyltransferase
MAVVKERIHLPVEATCHCCGMPCLSCGIEGYCQCTGCKAWQSMRPLLPEELYTDDYWSHDRGHSTIAEQWNNHTLPIYLATPLLCSWVEQCLREKPVGSRILEIGCTPGAFLFTMAVRGWTVRGQEASRGLCDDIARHTGLPAEWFTAGLFPQVLPQVLPQGRFDVIAAFDVLEHAPDPLAWLLAAGHLLEDDGVLLLQVPLFDPDDPSEFHEGSQGMWDPDEHIYVFTPSGMRRLLARAGFGDGDHESRRLAPGHELIVVRR